MPILRSLAYNLFYYAWTIILLLVLLPLLLLPSRKPLQAIARLWSAGNLKALTLLCGVTHDFRGIEKIPKGPYILASKHHSSLEIFALLSVVPDFAFIYKRELGLVPIFGWAVKRAEQIAVDRGKGGAALRSMAEGARQALDRGQTVMIFPEGTRRPVDAEPDYKFGTVHLYATLSVPCLPVAINAGLFWPRRTFMRQPGHSVVEFLEPIPPGLPPAVFAERLQNDIETATSKLVAEDRARKANALT